MLQSNIDKYITILKKVDVDIKLHENKLSRNAYSPISRNACKFRVKITHNNRRKRYSYRQTPYIQHVSKNKLYMTCIYRP